MQGYTGFRYCPPGPGSVYEWEARTGRTLAVQPAPAASRRSEGAASGGSAGADWTLPHRGHGESQVPGQPPAMGGAVAQATARGSTAVHPGRIAAIDNLFGTAAMEQFSREFNGQSTGQSSEQSTQQSTEDPHARLPAEPADRTRDRDVHTGIMHREKRAEAMAWVQAYRLIRGGVVDEVVEFIEGSQFTIELLVRMLGEASCHGCEAPVTPLPERCDFCERRGQLLAQLT